MTAQVVGLTQESEGNAGEVEDGSEEADQVPLQEAGNMSTVNRQDTDGAEEEIAETDVDMKDGSEASGAVRATSSSNWVPRYDPHATVPWCMGPSRRMRLPQDSGLRESVSEGSLQARGLGASASSLHRSGAPSADTDVEAKTLRLPADYRRENYPRAYLQPIRVPRSRPSIRSMSAWDLHDYMITPESGCRDTTLLDAARPPLKALRRVPGPGAYGGICGGVLERAPRHNEFPSAGSRRVSCTVSKFSTQSRF